MRKAQGFTLIELVTTAAIFGILGAMLLSVVRSGMDMWNRGEAQREEIERGSTVLETIADELRAAFTANDPASGRAEIRFLSDFLDFDCDGDGIKETRVQRLVFVRTNSEERRNGVMHRAGDAPLGRKYFSTATGFGGASAPAGGEGGGDASPSGLEGGGGGGDGYRPTGGLAEAFFMAFPPFRSGKPLLNEPLALYRGYRSPIGGENSFFAPGLLDRPAVVAASLSPLMEGILYLEFRFSDQDTYTFDSDEAPPGAKGGAGFTWDSTRGILPAEDPDGVNGFRLSRGPASAGDPRDDIFPDRVLITVVVAAGGKKEGMARLTESVKEDAFRIPVDAVRPFKERPLKERFVRLGAEWIRFSGLSGNELVVTERGARNTIAAAHGKGTPLFGGRTFTMQVAIPAHREFFDEDD